MGSEKEQASDARVGAGVEVSLRSNHETTRPTQSDGSLVTSASA